MTSFWAITSSMIAVFDISKALDADGKEINVALEFTHGFIRYVFLLTSAMYHISLLFVT